MRPRITLSFGDGPLTLDDVDAVARGRADFELSAAGRAAILQGRAVVERVVEAGLPAYGITTGVGSQKDFAVDREAVARYNDLMIAAHATIVPGVDAPPEVVRWARGRRKLFDFAKLSKAPIAIEALRRIDEIFAIERTILGKTRAERVAVRQALSTPLVTAPETFLREKRALLSAKSETAKAIDYSLNHWPALTRFLDDGRICFSNNAAERALRGIAIGRRNWTFCGSDAGGHRAAAIYTLIETAKLNDVDPQAWLAWVLAKLPDHPAKRIDEMLPWNWQSSQVKVAA